MIGMILGYLMKKSRNYDGRFRDVIDATNKLIEPPTEEERKLEIGFKVIDKGS